MPVTKVKRQQSVTNFELRKHPQIRKALVVFSASNIAPHSIQYGTMNGLIRARTVLLISK